MYAINGFYRTMQFLFNHPIALRPAPVERLHVSQNRPCPYAHLYRTSGAGAAATAISL